MERWHWYLNEPDDGDLVVPHRHLLDLGVPLASATDNIPYNPFFTLWSICNRRERVTDRVIGPKQVLTAEEGMRLLTTAGAQLTFEETSKGPLRPGYLADMAVLSKNPLDCSLDELKDIRCQLTMVGGKIVFDELSGAESRFVPNRRVQDLNY